MTDVKPDEKPPVTGGEPTGVKFPEDELADLEAKAKGEAGKTGDGSPSGDTGASSGTVDEDASVSKLSEFMRKKGINDVGRLVDLASDLESKNTKLAQENARLSAIPRGVGGVQAGGAMPQVPATVDDDIEVPANPIELVTNPGKLKEWAKKLVEYGDRRAQQREQQRTYGDVAARVQAKMEANPVEFKRLRPIMLELARENPNADVDALYNTAKDQYMAERKELVSEIKSELGLTGAETEKLRGIVSRVRQAPISGGTGTQVNVVAPTKADKEAKDLLTAIANADKF